MSIGRDIIKILFIVSVSVCIYAFPGCEKKLSRNPSAAPDSVRLQTAANLTEVTETTSDDVPNIAAVLYETNSGATTRIRVGDTLQIELRGNPTTGFGWEIKSYERSILKQAGNAQYEQDSSPASAHHVSGLGGIFRFRFKAIAAGQTMLRLVYRRSWESNSPTRVFETTVIVQ
jgi:inhibitor of cysteine peptidase